MTILTSVSWHAAVALRWAALIAGTLLFLFFLAFFFGEGPPNLARLSATERLQVLSITALFSGLVVAWKWQGVGGLITLGAFGLLAAIHPSQSRAWGLYTPAVIGMLHLLVWARLRTGAPPRLVPWHLPRSVVVFLCAALGVFVMLCVNELFGQPPLMTPALLPGRDLAGKWVAQGTPPAEFVVERDGSVTGFIGESGITDGKIVYGRSWFGRMMHMNSPYRVLGKLGSKKFSAPLRPVGATLDGSLFLEEAAGPSRIILARRQP